MYLVGINIRHETEGSENIEEAGVGHRGKGYDRKTAKCTFKVLASKIP